VEEVIHAGITVLATVHAGSLEELRARPGLKRLLEMRIFERVLFLGRSRGPGTVEQIMDPQSGKIFFSRSVSGQTGGGYGRADA
jgi:stage III sporulation protein AA